MVHRGLGRGRPLSPDLRVYLSLGVYQSLDDEVHAREEAVEQGAWKIGRQEVVSDSTGV